MSAPEFPGVSDADTPIYDQLLADTRCGLSETEAAAMAAEPFESWGLDERAPLPIVALIGELTARVGVGAAWALEMEVGAEFHNRRLMDGLGEEDDDEQPDDGPAGDAPVADGPARPPVVGADADNGQGAEGSG